MKKLLLISFVSWAIFTSKNSFSQSYTPFPEDSASWVVHSWFANTVDPGNTYYYYDYFRYYTGGDTTINSTHYIILKGDKKSYIDTTINGPVLGTTIGTHHILFYRNDSLNKKVYKLYADTGTTEYLWYDFDLQIGDSVNGFGPIPILSIDSIYICGKMRNRYNYDCYWGGSGPPYACMIEGIGNMSNFIGNACLIAEHGGVQNVCFIDYTSCSPGSSLCNIEVGIEDEFLTDKVVLFPNPTVNFLYFNEVFDVISVYDLSGKISLQEKYISSLDVSSLSTGLYIISVEKQGKKYYNRFIKQY